MCPLTAMAPGDSTQYCGFLFHSYSLLRAHFRQSIVNRFVLCEHRSCIPLPRKARLVERCSGSRNRSLERFALGLEKWSLYLFAKSSRSRTHPGSLGVVSFHAQDSGITFQAPGDVGGAAECAKAHEGLPVACFRQI